MRWTKRYLRILAFGYVVLQTGVALADCKVLSEKSSMYRELMPIVVKWKDALLSKSIKKLAGHALQDQQEWVFLNLNDRKSNLYHYLYEEKHSIFHLLQKAKKLRIILVECVKEEYVEFGPGAEVYYFDEEKIKPQFPLIMTKYQELYKKGYIFVHYWGKEQGKWYTNYNFFPDNPNNDLSK
jgi:hypothetical protein